MVGVVFLLLQFFVAMVFFALNMLCDSSFDATALIAGTGNDGFRLVEMTTVNSLLATGTIMPLVKMRDGPSVGGYSRLMPVGPRRVLSWLAATLAVVAAWGGLFLMLERPLVPEFMLDIYKTGGFLSLCWLAIVVLAPVFKKVFFRGLMFAGLERSKCGGPGTIVVTALAWAVIHVQ